MIIGNRYCSTVRKQVLSCRWRLHLPTESFGKARGIVLLNAEQGRGHVGDHLDIFLLRGFPHAQI